MSWFDISTLTDPPSPPLTSMLSSQQDGVSSSLLTLTWSPPSSTGGVSVNYTLTISPPPLSGSPVIVETTSTQITVSYNTPYIVTIRAVNCAGMSDDTLVTIFSIGQLLLLFVNNLSLILYKLCIYLLYTVTCPSNPPPANRVTLSDTPPSPALVGSTLSFTCNGQTVSATCESDGQWSPNPSTYQCLPRKVYSLSPLLLAHSSQPSPVVLLLHLPEAVWTSIVNLLPSHWVQR